MHKFLAQDRFAASITAFLAPYSTYPDIRLSFYLVVTLLLCGCAGSAISPETRELALPDQWAKEANAAPITERWLETFADSSLNALVAEALIKNYQLAQQEAQLEEFRQAVVTSGAARWPTISLDASGSRRKTLLNDNTSSFSENYEADANLSWELDIWGKLSNNQKQARLSYEANRATLLNARQQLAADTASAWYNLIEANALLRLFQQRLRNVQQNLDIIQRGYRQGINEALDLYLTQDTVAQEQSRVADQRQTLINEISNLQLLLARYPDGSWSLDAELPVFETQIPVGLPSELLTRRPDIQAAWMNLLATDASLAVAHKQRFPTISLVASAGDASASLSDLLDKGSLGWSLLGNLTYPLFDGRRLRSLEGQAKARVNQAEQAYLDKVFSALAEVETSISRAKLLAERYAALLMSETSAKAAYRLSFEQYQRGLVSYTTVLEAQRRAFDGQTNVIRARNQLIQNRIGLYLALGGDFASSSEQPPL